MLISLRLVQGLGSAMLFGTSLAIVSSVFPPGERGKALGITIAAVYLGLSMGPLLGGYMTAYLGWRSIFLVNVPLGALCILFTYWKLPLEWRTAEGEKFDLRGSILWGSALVVLIFGLSLIPDRAGLLLAVAGTAGILLFASLELRLPHPVLDIRLFSNNRVFAFSNLAALINYSATYAVTFLLSLYLQITKDFSPATAGLILVAQPVTMAFFAPLSGRLSDRVEPARVASLGMAFTAGGLFLLAMIGPGSSLTFLIVSLIVLGIGFGIFSSPNTNAILSSVDRTMYGVASGMVGTMRLLGQMFSMAVAMTLFSVFIGREEISDANLPEFLLSMHAAFYLFFLLCVAGIFFSLVRGRSIPGTGEPP
ncbi:MAG: MFS transporter, partial [Methanolinea sp.]|nr:MFS transporter [Methanolinea sp.]